MQFLFLSPPRWGTPALPGHAGGVSKSHRKRYREGMARQERRWEMILKVQWGAWCQSSCQVWAPCPHPDSQEYRERWGGEGEEGGLWCAGLSSPASQPSPGTGKVHSLSSSHACARQRSFQCLNWRRRMFPSCFHLLGQRRHRSLCKIKEGQRSPACLSGILPCHVAFSSSFLPMPSIHLPSPLLLLPSHQPEKGQAW